MRPVSRHVHTDGRQQMGRHIMTVLNEGGSTRACPPCHMQAALPDEHQKLVNVGNQELECTNQSLTGCRRVTNEQQEDLKAQSVCSQQICPPLHNPVHRCQVCSVQYSTTASTKMEIPHAADAPAYYGSTRNQRTFSFHARTARNRSSEIHADNGLP